MTTLGLFLGLGLVAMVGCGGSGDASTDPAGQSESSDEEISSAQRAAAISACHLDDGTVEANADVHACAPGDKKKTTICHVPPGNPANAHTLCIGNAAVSHHLANHPDYLGPCHSETTCPAPTPPPPVTGAGGSSGTGGTGGLPDVGAGGSTGAGGNATGAGGSSDSGTGGAAGAGGRVIID